MATQAEVAEKSADPIAEQGPPDKKRRVLAEHDAEETATVARALRLSYFSLWAKGPSCALALAHSGLEWEGSPVEPSNWANLKQSTPWRHVPILELPDGQTIGHEIAILNCISRLAKAMAGVTMKDFAASQQLLHQSEDLYQKFVKFQPTINAKDKSREDLAKMWGDAEISSHNYGFSYASYLLLLEEFYHKCNAGEGHFTDTGRTVGECKLFAVLHVLVTIKVDVLVKFPGLAAFYRRFGDLMETREIVQSGDKMGRPFVQYFTSD